MNGSKTEARGAQGALDGLQAAWTRTENAEGTKRREHALSDAVGAMRSLQGPAQTLMQIEIGGGVTGNYGPDFIV